MRLVFMGTPDFAVPALENLLAAGHTVAGVFCQPDRPKGRGHKLAPPPVKQAALAHGIPVFQPASVKTEESLALLRRLAPACIVVVAYGKILPPAVLELPPLGCVNIHASLLPRYRGAAPIQWAVIHGDAETGVTTMQMDAGMDTGAVLEQVSCPIPPDMTAGELFNTLSALGGQLILSTLRGLEAGTLTPRPQDHAKATAAPMLDRSLSQVDWRKPAEEIHNLIRGLNPWPSAKTTLAGATLKLHASRVLGPMGGQPGQVLAAPGLTVCCGDGNALRLTLVQAEGSRPMEDEAYLRGHPVAAGTVLG